jgi:hypothetical protein
MKKFSELNIESTVPMSGDKVKMKNILNIEIQILDFRIDESLYKKNKSGNRLQLQMNVNGEAKILFTGSEVLMGQIEQVKKEDLPFSTIIKQVEDYYIFT